MLLTRDASSSTAILPSLGRKNHRMLGFSCEIIHRSYNVGCNVRGHSGHVVDNCEITLMHTCILRSYGITQSLYYTVELSRSYAITQFGCCQYSAGFDKSASCANRRRMPLRTVGLTLRRLYPRHVFVNALVADSHDLDDGSLTLEPSQDAVDANARAPAAL